ncbi:glycosyltransferase family 22 protein [Serendipita vermifera MAFF 305830]|uniref:Mannosyltransferase n=1 Tax=Serendipita vermifera MAFF 305830 TaxID=933852 RepID=A0A0C3B9U4_SERVB|nr:glycosyltransferase family 22 protein [Serendipita vermifera MAFF 305830]
MRTNHVVGIAIAVRVTQALLTQTFFQPDEYFQSLEVAHRAVFGYGQLTWEWSIERPIRSIVFPSLWIPVYWILYKTNLHNTGALIWAPKIISGLIASLSDIAVCRLSAQLLGPSSVPITLLTSLTSFFHALSLVRSMSNSLETSLTVLAVSYWPLQPHQRITFKTLFRSVAIAALTCAIRPTNIVIWTYLSLELLLRRVRKTTSSFVTFLSCVVPLGGLIPLLQVFADSAYFDKWTFTPLNFLKVNLSPISLFYGGNPWHYYLTQAIPILLTSCLPLFLHGVYLILLGRLTPRGSHPAFRTLLGLLAWTIAIYSMAGHKEWRFIHPVLPIMHIFCTVSLMSRKTAGTSNLAKLLTEPKGFIILLSLPVIVYTTFIHGRAQIAVMHHLRSLPPQNLQSVGFLMPCHSTPWMAYLHRPQLDGGKAWSLGCEPPLRVPSSSQYLDQTTAFYFSPVDYLRDYFPQSVDPSFPTSPRPKSDPSSSSPLPMKANTRYAKRGFYFVDSWKHTWPQHLVMFGVLPKVENPDTGETVGYFLRKKGYERSWRTFNGFEEDDKRRGGVEVWSWQGVS